MLVSTKGRYALRVMLELAERPEGEYAALATIAEDQGISEKYLESIISVLSRAGLVDALRGKGGGYRLCRAPENITVGEVLRVTEGELAPVSCLECGAKPCSRAAYCKTLPMWKEYYRLTNEYFDHISLADLLGNEAPGDYVI